MGLFSRKSKQQQQPAAEQPPGSPLSPPETRYANARPPTPQHLQSHYQQQYQQQRASSDRLPPPPPQQQEQQQHQRAGPSRSESPLPPAPRQQPRASGSYIRPPPREYDHGRPTSDLSGDEDELDAGGGRAYAGQSAMRPPAAVGSSSSSSSSYRWQPPSPPALEREPSDPAKWQLPALGLSPPTSLSLLAPLGLGLRTDNGAASASNSRSSSPPTAPLPSPRNTGGSELGHGYPSSPATADVRSRSSFLRCVPFAFVRKGFSCRTLIESLASWRKQHEFSNCSILGTHVFFACPATAEARFRPLVLGSIVLARRCARPPSPSKAVERRPAPEQLRAAAVESDVRPCRTLRRLRR